MDSPVDKQLIFKRSAKQFSGERAVFLTPLTVKRGYPNAKTELKSVLPTTYKS